MVMKLFLRIIDFDRERERDDDDGDDARQAVDYCREFDGNVCFVLYAKYSRMCEYKLIIYYVYTE